MPDSDMTKHYGKDVAADAHKTHMDALMYFHTLREFEPLGFHTEIVLGDEVSQKALSAYSGYLHEFVFPGSNPSRVKEVVGDGHSKVMTKCTGHVAHGGQPRKRKQKKTGSWTNGWFFVVATDGEILVVRQQVHPENNADVEKAFAAAVKKCSEVDCIIYDRNCAFAKSVWHKDEFKNVKYWPIDKWHGSAGTARVPHPPLRQVAQPAHQNR